MFRPKFNYISLRIFRLFLLFLSFVTHLPPFRIYHQVDEFSRNTSWNDETALPYALINMLWAFFLDVTFVQRENMYEKVIARAIWTCYLHCYLSNNLHWVITHNATCTVRNVCTIKLFFFVCLQYTGNTEWALFMFSFDDQQRNCTKKQQLQ